MNDALKRQVGGSHYVSMKVQPFEFAMRNGWDSCAFSICKYVSRHRSPTGKGLQDVMKAGHIVEIRQALLPGATLHTVRTMWMEVYCRLNELNARDTAILMMLEAWVSAKGSAHMDVDYPGNIMSGLTDLATEYAKR